MDNSKCIEEKIKIFKKEVANGEKKTEFVYLNNLKTNYFKFRFSISYKCDRNWTVRH
jgi:hypothetical protein